MEKNRNWIDKQSRAWLSSESLFSRILGALFFQRWVWVTLVFVVMTVVLPLVSLINWHSIINNEGVLTSALGFVSVVYRSKLYKLIVVFLAAILVIFCVCRLLTNIYTLRKNEKGITRCQIVILITIGLWIVGFIWAFNLQDSDTSKIVFGIAGALLVWIFQEKVKGAVTFIHLRSNNLLNIDDWIKVPKYNVDGEVKHVSLTTVTVYNWDTTTSTIPISALQADHFINLQSMVGGKTYGRRMLMSFVLDTSWFHSMSEKELDFMMQQILLYDQGQHPKKEDGRVEGRPNEPKCLYFPEEEIKEGAMNAHLYRLYVYHWLMRHDHVSQQPRLIVRWMEPKESGTPLQVCAFIVDSDSTAFEWQQSQIIEHIVESMDWFGLRLYQSPSAYDVSNSNIFMADKPATYRKEVAQ